MHTGAPQMPVALTQPCFLRHAKDEESIDESRFSALASNCELMSEVRTKVSQRGASTLFGTCCGASAVATEDGRHQKAMVQKYDISTCAKT